MSLLDIFSTYEGQQGLGLLAAAGPRSDGAGFGQRLQEGLAYADKWQQGKQRQSLDDMKMKEFETEMRDKQLGREKALANQEAIRRMFTPISGGQAMMNGQGPTLENAGNIGQMPKFDPATFFQNNPSADLSGLKSAMDVQQLFNPAKKLMNVPQGNVVIDERTGTPVFTAPMAPEKDPEQIRQLKIIYGDGTPAYQAALQKLGAKVTTHQAPVTVNMGDGQKGFDNELKLAAAFKQEPIYKDHAAVQSAFSQITASLAQGSPISDTAAATKIMKILDPGSVVRESELGMAMAAGGRMDRLKDYINQTMNGTKLTPQQRIDFGRLAAELTGASAQAYNSKRSEYHQQGKDYGLNSDRALGKPVEVPSAMLPKESSAKLSIQAPNGKTYTFANEREMRNWKMSTGVK